jgi:hypothetical protein
MLQHRGSSIVRLVGCGVVGDLGSGESGRREDKNIFDIIISNRFM